MGLPQKYFAYSFASYLPQIQNVAYFWQMYYLASTRLNWNILASFGKMDTIEVRIQKQIWVYRRQKDSIYR